LTASERITYKNTKQTNFLDSNELYDFIKSNVTMDLDNHIHKECDESNIPTRAISLMFNQRSVDTFLGLPFNIASYGLLLEIIAKAVNMVPDELIGNLGDVHLYNNHIEQAKEQISREPFELPTLKINSGNENWHLLTIDEIINSLDVDITFKVENYQSHPTIKAPLSN
jgi:thymidylate synthase